MTAERRLGWLRHWASNSTGKVDGALLHEALDLHTFEKRRADKLEAELARMQPVVEAAQSLTSALEANTIAGPSLKSLMVAVAALDGAAAERAEGGRE